ncbi:MAG: hypothetical protein KME43_16750 [Myxacorys chilensis ATA2-1-KO14]|nr:hypothetical protein [Myxacorys chilensis ATA2-1-KO14]
MTPNDVMQVVSGAPTPWNPGDNSEIRTQEVISKHQNFTKKEADQLRVKAATRTKQSKDNRAAYAALRKIETADVRDQVAFRGYQTTVARAVAGKKGADVAKAKVLANLTPTYAGMGYTLGAAQSEAAVRVQELQALHSEVNKRW